MQMEPRELWEMYTNVGFGQRPQIEFPGARSGVLRPYRNWKPVDQSRLAFGYGLSASLLQMARAYTVFARDGELVPITMLRQDQPAAGVRVLSPEVAREMRRMLQLATESGGGTATRAQAVGYSVAGKTGTAHAYDGGEYASNKHRAWFVGLAPVSNPRIVVAVMVDQPSQGGHFGGEVAAPVFSQVVQQTLRLLNVPPDIEVRRQIVAQTVAQAPAAALIGAR
jgi:cell division protein FtsI (penicillin-binding protein 3)